MPSHYAHYRFGRDVLHALPVGLQQQLVRHRTLFDLGLQGPDLFFVSRTASSSAAQATGYQLHTEPANFFLEFARGQLSDTKTQELQYAYLYGYICHFALDRQCNPYLLCKSKALRLSCREMEIAFDQFLLKEDCRTSLPSLSVRPAFAAAVAPFFPHLKRAQLLQVLRTTETPGRYFSLSPVSGAAKAHCMHLFKLYQTAVREAVRLIVTYQAACRDNRPLPADFRNHFGLPIS